MGLEPGYHVSKHVKLVRMLKRGGMGSVWIAEHLALQTQVAVKFMSAEVADDPAMVTRFAREATSAAQIKSPHVVQVHDHGVTPEGDPFIVMELLEGEDLASRIKRVGQMSIEDVATILLQSCRVLGKAHQMGIVHRDIKPSNIFLADTDGEIFIKLLDFGVAKMGGETEEITTTGAMVGTVVYMSPEQLLSARRVDHRSDLWSLAVVAYRALTGGLPFKDDEGLGALCRALDAGIFFPPSELRPSLPPEMDAWFDRAFQREPDKRFQSARELVDEFFLASGMAQAIMPPSTPSVSLRAVRDGLNSRRQEISVAAKSVRVERSFRSDPTVVPGRADPVTRPSRVEPTPAPRREDPTKSPLELGRPASKSAPDVAASASTATEEPASLGVAPALTLAGRASKPALPPRRSFASRLLIAVGVLGALGVGAVFGLRYLGLSHLLLDLPRGLSIAPTVEDVGVRSATPLPPTPVAATAPIPSAAPSTLVVPGPTASAVGAPSAASAASLPSAVPTARASASAPAATPSGAPTATPSGAPAVSGSGKPSGKAGGTSRSTKPEKDYGF